MFPCFKILKCKGLAEVGQCISKACYRIPLSCLNCYNYFIIGKGQKENGLMKGDKIETFRKPVHISPSEAKD